MALTGNGMPHVLVFYCCSAKDLNTDGLSTAHIYYLPVSVGQVSGRGLAGPLAQVEPPQELYLISRLHFQWLLADYTSMTIKSFT